LRSTGRRKGNSGKEVGYTYHYIDAGTDTGDIIIQEPLKIEEFDTQETLYIRAMLESMKKFSLAFAHVTNGLPGKKQDGISSYYPRGCPHEGEIDPNWEYSYKERFIRAMIYPPYPVAKLGGREIFTIRDLENG